MHLLLVVDDELLLLDALDDLLSSEGYSVNKAADGQEALDVLHKAAKPDLIVSDIYMPELTGLELFDEVRARPEWSDIPFLFISANTTVKLKDERTNLTTLSNSYFLRKPFAVDAFLDTIRQILEDLPR